MVAEISKLLGAAPFWILTRGYLSSCYS